MLKTALKDGEKNEAAAVRLAAVQSKSWCFCLLTKNAWRPIFDSEKCAHVRFGFIIYPEIAKGNDDKFKKMKDIYAKLREEHVQLIRTVSLLISLSLHV